MSRSWNEGEREIVFFDLETSGFEADCDILQVALKCGSAVFSCYVQPSKPVDPGATKKNGLTNFNGRLLLRGKEVLTCPLQDVMAAVIEFLQKFKKPCMLVAHNCYDFDAPRIIRAIKICKLESAFQKVVAGFVDSLILSQYRFTDRYGRGKHTLTSLAKDLLGIDTSGAHDALADTQMLEQFFCKFFKHNAIVMVASPLSSFLK